MQPLPQAVVVLAGARDHYQLPLALHEAGLLRSLVTDMYWPADRRWFSGSVGRLLPARVTAARYCVGLDSRRVSVSGQALAMSAAMKAARTRPPHRHNDKRLNRKTRRIPRHTRAALFAY